MPVRREVQELVDAGLPSEEDPLEDIERAEQLLESITSPVSDEEAQQLATAFGPDTCFGLAGTLLHLIETAPGASTASYQQDADNWWVQRLNARVQAARENL
ncbi:hypothetical protein ADK70_31455 [Streptomyces rimosus subsp. pseudoverticillatus]|nr:hypothetical protein ADK70_31455 [Streptomyces rimosus subsp. pseudoverticillatus]